jgi:hypothetical protein
VAKVAKSDQSVTINIKLEPSFVMLRILPVMKAAKVIVNKFPIN